MSAAPAREAADLSAARRARQRALQLLTRSCPWPASDGRRGARDRTRARGGDSARRPRCWRPATAAGFDSAVLRAVSDLGRQSAHRPARYEARSTPTNPKLRPPEAGAPHSPSTTAPPRLEGSRITHVVCEALAARSVLGVVVGRTRRRTRPSGSAMRTWPMSAGSTSSPIAMAHERRVEALPLRLRRRHPVGRRSLSSDWLKKALSAFTDVVRLELRVSSASVQCMTRGARPSTLIPAPTVVVVCGADTAARAGRSQVRGASAAARYELSAARRDAPQPMRSAALRRGQERRLFLPEF